MSSSDGSLASSSSEDMDVDVAGQRFGSGGLAELKRTRL